MDLFEAVAKRHSYRGSFTDAPVPREDLQRIVQAGIQAPSGKNEQTTSFVVIDDPELLAKAAGLIGKPVCDSAKAMIVCVTDPRPVLNGMAFHLEDCAASVENMLLAITALGYATVWLDGVLRADEKAEKLASLLGVPEEFGVRIVLPIGVPTEVVAQAKKLPFEQRAFFNKYGA